MKKTNLFCCLMAFSALVAGCSHKQAANPAAPGSKPTTTTPPKQAPLSKSQALGIDLVHAFQGNALLSKTSISVGTTTERVTLDGKVPSAAAKTAAFSIAQKKAPGYKVINRLTIGVDKPVLSGKTTVIKVPAAKAKQASAKPAGAKAKTP